MASAAADTALVRRKHQYNSALVQPKNGPKKPSYAPVWTGAGAVPLGARRLSVEGRSEARFPDSQQVRPRNFGSDSSIDMVSDVLGKGPLPASWCTNVFPKGVPAAPVAYMLGDTANGDGRAGGSNIKVTVLSAKPAGKQPAVHREPEPESAAAPELQPVQAYAQPTFDIHHTTPSSQADKQWALEEAEKVYARQAEQDPSWTDTSSDSEDNNNHDDEVVCLGSKRRSPTPDPEPSSTPMKKTRSKDRRECYRSRNRRYETLRSPKSIQQRDQLLAAITRNWNGNIRLAIPEDIGPRRAVGGSKQNVPAQAQDWATCSLEAAKALSEISKGDPESAQRALRRVVMSPGREWRWLSNPQDFIAAAKLLIEEGQGPKSPSVALSEDIRSRLFVTPTPDTTGMDVDDVEVIDLGEGESTGQADVVAVIRPKDKPIRELLLAHAEASAREALAKQRKQDLIEGAYDAERGQEFIKAWREENNARIQKEGLEEDIETLFAASEA